MVTPANSPTTTAAPAQDRNVPAAASADDSSTTMPPRMPGVWVLMTILGALSALAPLAIDMYVPAFPQMSADLHTSSAAIQLTMTAFLTGLVLGQLLFGPLSDSWGRRKLLLAGILGFFVLSIACAFAPTIGILLFARFLQGMAAAIGMVLARAIITDVYPAEVIPTRMAVISQIIGIAPVLAPVIGGAVLSVAVWRWVFAVLAVIGLVLSIAVFSQVKESLPRERRHTGGLRESFAGMGRLLGHRPFLGTVLVLGGITAAFFCYVNASSFVFESIHGVSATTYSLIFASNAAAMLVVGVIFGICSQSFGVNRFLGIGVGLCLLASIALVVVLLTVGESFAGTWICLFVFSAGNGLVIPSAMSLGQSLGRSAPGAASAAIGGFQFLFGAVASPIAGFFGQDSALPMALIMLVGVLVATVALVTLQRPWERHGEYSH